MNAQQFLAKVGVTACNSLSIRALHADVSRPCSLASSRLEPT